LTRHGFIQRLPEALHQMPEGKALREIPCVCAAARPIRPPGQMVPGREPRLRGGPAVRLCGQHQAPSSLPAERTQPMPTRCMEGLQLHMPLREGGPHLKSMLGVHEGEQDDAGPWGALPARSPLPARQPPAEPSGERGGGGGLGGRASGHGDWGERRAS